MVNQNPNFDRKAHKHPPIEDITQSASFRLSQLVAINDRAAQHWIKDLFDVTLNEWRVIGVICAHGPLRASALSKTLVMDKSQVSRLIRHLIARGVVQSVAAEDDARAVHLSLTEAGGKLHDRILHEVAAGNERFIDPLSREEIAQLSDFLTRLTEHSRKLLARRES